MAIKRIGISKLKRSLNSYLDSRAIRSESSKKSDKFALDSFSEFLRKFHQINPDEAIDSFKDHQVAIDTLQAWINWFSTTEKSNGKTKYVPSAITTFQYFRSIIRYLHYMGIKFHSLDLEQEIVLPTIEQKTKHGLTLDEIKLLLGACSFDKKAIYLAELSSGMRIGELMQIRKKNLDLSQRRIMVRIPAQFTKLRRERVTFLSKEFDKHYRSRINQLNDDDLLFTTNENWESARDNEIQNMFGLVKRTGLKDITTHSFRAYFITKLSRKDYNFAKLLAGQKGYLLQYDRMNESEKLGKYLEFESELLIFEQTTDGNVVELQKQVDEMQDQMVSVAGGLQRIIDDPDALDKIKNFMKFIKANEDKF